MTNKSRTRREMKNRLSLITKPVYEDLSYKIAQNLYKEPDWKEAEIIGITVSIFPEADTYQIIRKAWESGKKVAVPKCIPSERRMDFREIQHFSQLESVYYGLFEPVECETKAVGKDEIDLLIVPGLAYTRDGYRLGFGGGYFDRYLKSYSGKTLSLAFEMQILDQLPVAGHDIPVAKIITNAGVAGKSG
jgi:5-formyltetrahydrofolate cyclo-ligase